MVLDKTIIKTCMLLPPSQLSRLQVKMICNDNRDLHRLVLSFGRADGSLTTAIEADVGERQKIR